MMKISLLIVTKKWKPDQSTFINFEKLKVENVSYEVLVAEGNNPSSQRNFLASEAEGEFILFLDDDSIPEENLLEQYCKTLMLSPETEMIGGPSVLSEDSSFLNPLSRIFFGSSFGAGPIRSRYTSFGGVRKATERDLILCNLMFKKDFFLKTKGFSQDLYPGEENEFIKNISGSSHILYDPLAIVHRSPRPDFLSFLMQMFSYGKGRSKHLKLLGTDEWIFLIPFFFTSYVLLLPAFFKVSLIFLIPILIHFVLSIVLNLKSIENSLKPTQVIVLPLVFFAGHFCYGFGMLFGFIKYKTPIKRIFTKNK